MSDLELFFEKKEEDKKNKIKKLKKKKDEPKKEFTVNDKLLKALGDMRLKRWDEKMGYGDYEKWCELNYETVGRIWDRTDHIDNWISFDDFMRNRYESIPRVMEAYGSS